MARNVSRGDLRDQVRFRTDTQNETRRFPNTELDMYVNEGIAAFHRQMVRARGQGFGEATTTVTTANGVENYALPAAFLSVVKVWFKIDGVEHVLHDYEEWDTQGLVDVVSWKSSYVDFAYRLTGDNISLRPIPSDAVDIRVKYIATAVKLVADSNTVDGVDGLEEYAVLWAAKRVAIKQRDELLMGLCDAEMGKVLDDLMALQRARNAAEAPRMGDVHPERLSWRRSSRRYPPA